MFETLYLIIIGTSFAPGNINLTDIDSSNVSYMILQRKRSKAEWPYGPPYVLQTSLRGEIP